MKNWMNLYTYLIDHVDNKYCFGDRVQEDINYGKIKVNGATPEDINMPLKVGDKVTVYGLDFEVYQEQMI